MLMILQLLVALSWRFQTWSGLYVQCLFIFMNIYLNSSIHIHDYSTRGLLDLDLDLDLLHGPNPIDYPRTSANVGA